MSTKSKLSIGVLLVALATWFYFTPHIAFHGMRSAAEDKDAARLSGYVNFPALKDSLKASFNAKLASNVMNDKNGGNMTAFSAALTAAIVNPIIDALVTPEGLAMMMKGEKPAPSPKDSQSKSEPNPDVSMSYEAFDRFVVEVKKRGSNDVPVSLVFSREGIFSWKLSAMRLPI